MDGSPEAAPDGDALELRDGAPPDIVIIAPRGDVILDVLFETSKETLQSVRRATRPRPGQRPEAASVRPVLKPKLRVAYRVESGVLMKQSKYFYNLLGDTRFKEARTVAAAFEDMTLRNVKPAELAPVDLPWIRIEDDDEASRSAGRELVFAELLRVLHGRETLKSVKNPPTLLELATLAILADRFDCAAPASTYVRNLRFRFPAAQIKASGEDGGLPSLANEEAIRQKILVSWLLDQPLRFHPGTRELILYGSSRWGPYPDEDDAHSAAWWDLPDDLERELQFRRECILNCIASVQKHFLSLYTSRNRQCKLGYGSSSSCDSFQLGEMVKFLTHKNLLFLVDFSPASLDVVRDTSMLDLYHILAALKQCPGYQIDKDHMNCGLRTRMLPILDYIHTMLSSNVVAVARAAWKDKRAVTSWIPDEREDGRDRGDGVFRFTRSLAGDQRLRLEGAMAAESMAKQLFTAAEWNWTPED